MLDLLFEADLSSFFLGQVFADLRYHRFELLVGLFAFLIIRLQCVMEGNITCVSSLEVLEIFGSPSLYQNRSEKYEMNETPPRTIFLLNSFSMSKHRHKLNCWYRDKAFVYSFFSLR